MSPLMLKYHDTRVKPKHSKTRSQPTCSCRALSDGSGIGSKSAPSFEHPAAAKSHQDPMLSPAPTELYTRCFFPLSPVTVWEGRWQTLESQGSEDLEVRLIQCVPCGSAASARDSSPGLENTLPSHRCTISSSQDSIGTGPVLKPRLGTMVPWVKHLPHKHVA